MVYVLAAGVFFSGKTRPWIFGACILWMLSISVDFIRKMGRPLPRNVSNSRNCLQKTAFPYLLPGPAGPTEVVS